MSIAPDQQLSHYRLVEEIGEGGMGAVYRAFDTRLERYVAIKVLQTGLLRDERARERFRREALTLSRLNHPNIATVYDFDSDQGLDFLVMEYIDGDTIARKIAGGPFPEAEILKLGTLLAEGLSAAHEAGVVHRDLKPGNLMVTPTGRLKILDFGLAKLLQQPEQEDTAETVTRTQRPAGTLPYMAPEQLRGEEIDARSDLFATGTVLYEMSTGHRPFPQDQVAQLITAILQDVPRPPRELRSDLSPGLERVIEKCLRKSPDKRYQSSDELGRELRALAADSSTPRKRSLAPWPFVLGGTAVAMLVVAAFFGTRSLRPTVEPDSGTIQAIAVLPLENLSGEQEEYFADGMTHALTNDLARIGSLTVISRRATRQVSDVRKSLRQIGRELGIDAVIEGSVLRVGDSVRITVELVDAATAENLWAGNYERDVRNVLALQREVASAIAAQVAAVVTPQERAGLADSRPVDPEAHEAYLRGVHSYSKSIGCGDDALRHFERAVRIDPNFAMAHATLGECYTDLAFFGEMEHERAQAEARRAAMKALELEENLADAHLVLAYVHAADWEWPEAERRYRKAIELRPGDAGFHYEYSGYCVVVGRLDEAIAELRRARQLDPLAYGQQLGETLIYAGRYDEAVDHLSLVVELEGEASRAASLLGIAYVKLGEYDRGIEVLLDNLESRGVNPDVSSSLELGYAYAVSGRTASARRIAERAQDRWRRGEASPSDVAKMYAAIGQADEAFRLLDEALAIHDSGALWIKTHWAFENLRSDPRFAELLRRMRLPME